MLRRVLCATAVGLTAFVSGCGRPSFAQPRPGAAESTARDAATAAPAAPAATAHDAADAGVAALEDPTEFTDWFARRGVPARAAAAWFARVGRNGVPRCEPRTVGAPPESALVCELMDRAERGHGDAQLFRRVQRVRIWVVRARQPAEVLDLQLSVQPEVVEDFNAPCQLDLEYELAADGLAVSVHDPRAATAPALHGGVRPLVGCDAARVANVHAAAYDRRWAGFDRGLIERSCAARGAWTWRGGRYVHTTRVPTPVRPP